jgi:hypothetical protein
MITIDVTKEQITEAAKVSFRPRPEEIHQYTPHFIDVLEARAEEVTGYPVTCAGHLFVVRDFFHQCHFALGVGRQINIHWKDQDRLALASDIFEKAVESKNYDAIEDFSIEINYHPPPQDKVIKFEDSTYLKDFERGTQVGYGWPVCSECKQKLGMASREDQSRSAYWICPTHGEVPAVEAMDGGKLGQRLSPPIVEYTDNPGDAAKMNSYLRERIVEDLVDAGYKVK